MAGGHRRATGVAIHGLISLIKFFPAPPYLFSLNCNRIKFKYLLPTNILHLGGHLAKKLKISTDGEYRVDSLNLQLTAFKDEIDLWPSQVAIRDYKVTVDGRMTLDKNGEYHLTVTETPVFLPNRMGLKLSGPINNLEYEFEKPKFPTLYKPNKRNDLEQMYTDLKKRIADCMKENVR